MFSKSSSQVPQERYGEQQGEHAWSKIHVKLFSIINSSNFCKSRCAVQYIYLQWNPTLQSPQYCDVMLKLCGF